MSVAVIENDTFVMLDTDAAIALTGAARKSYVRSFNRYCNELIATMNRLKVRVTFTNESRNRLLLQPLKLDYRKSDLELRTSIIERAEALIINTPDASVSTAAPAIKTTPAPAATPVSAEEDRRYVLDWFNGQTEFATLRSFFTLPQVMAIESEVPDSLVGVTLQTIARDLANAKMRVVNHLYWSPLVTVHPVDETPTTVSASNDDVASVSTEILADEVAEPVSIDSPVELDFPDEVTWTATKTGQTFAHKPADLEQERMALDLRLTPDLIQRLGLDVENKKWIVAGIKTPLSGGSASDKSYAFKVNQLSMAIKVVSSKLAIKHLTDRAIRLSEVISLAHFTALNPKVRDLLTNPDLHLLVATTGTIKWATEQLDIVEKFHGANKPASSSKPRSTAQQQKRKARSDRDKAALAETQSGKKNKS